MEQGLKNDAFILFNVTFMSSQRVGWKNASITRSVTLNFRGPADAEVEKTSLKYYIVKQINHVCVWLAVVCAAAI